MAVKDEQKRKASDDIQDTTTKRFKKSSTEEVEDDETKANVTYSTFPVKPAAIEERNGDIQFRWVHLPMDYMPRTQSYTYNDD